MTAAGAADTALAIAGLPVLAATSYLFGLTLLSGRTEAPPYGEAQKRFTIIVPAHDEELGIGATVESLLAVDYPAALRRVLVVADNCTDATAARAEAAGATVLVREDAANRGKGYALALAFERVLADDFAGAVVVVDADTTVSPNLLRACAARFEAGAHAVQAEYGVRNPNVSWRTRLMVIALALFHVLRSLGRERLGVSAGLRGNGMAFSREVLREVPHDAFSVVEDLEYGIRLGQAGHRVSYAGEAHVLGEMVSSERQSRSQRTRWEAGRFAIARTHALPLLSSAARKRSLMLLDLAIDVLIPPLSYIAVLAFLGALVTSSLWLWFGGSAMATIPWLTALSFLILYVLRGVALAKVGPRGLLDLMWAPVYIAWKILLTIKQRGKKKDVWVRTTREEQPR